MNLDSVRSLKQEVADETRRAKGDTPEAFSFYAATEPPMPIGVALGVASDGKGGHLLAVRVESADLAEPFVARAKGEADVRVVTVTKRTTPGYLQGARRPLEPGLQVGMSDRNFVGTLGCFVRDDAGRLYVLSNSHVLADEGKALAGHPFGQPFGDPAHRVGVLARFVPFSETAPNLVDAALGRLDKTEALVAYHPSVPTGLSRSREVTPDDLGRAVFKVGRTTGARRGTITAVEVDGLPVGYDRGVLRFNDQVEVSGGPATDFSAPGDSGSLIVTENGDALALLFAGGRDDKGEDFTYGNRLVNVLSALGVRLA